MIKKQLNLTLLKQNDQKDEQQVQMQENYKKIIKYFHHSLPTNFNFNSNVIYGQCKIQVLPNIQYNQNTHQQVQALFLQEYDRKISKYIANNSQILFLQVDNYIHQKTLRNKYNHTYYSVKYCQVVQIKISLYYGDIMLMYIPHLNPPKSDITYVKSIIIQTVDIGFKKQHQLRSYLQRYCNPEVNKNTKIMKCQCTLLNNCHLTLNQVISGKKNEEDKKMATNKMKIVSSRDIKSTKVINLRKVKEQIISQLIAKNDKGQNLINKKNLNSIVDINKIYCFYTDNVSKKITQFSQVQSYIVSKCISRNISDTKKLFTLKTIPLQKIQNSQELLWSLCTQCQVYKHQEVITPYIPVLDRVQQIGDLFVMEYKHFEGLTLRQILLKDKINIQRKSMRQLIAQIVMAVGHIHQCGFIYTVDIDNIIINYDGHILLTDVGSLKKMRNCQNGNEMIEKKQQGSNSMFQIQTMINNLRRKPKDFKKKSLEQFMQPKKQKFSWDWWALGLLLYQIIEKKNYFELATNMQVYGSLIKDKSELNLLSIEKKLEKQGQLLNLVRNLLKKKENQRLGSKNDYHSILADEYFKQIDKKKLTRRQGDGIMKIKHIKFDEKNKGLSGIRRQQIVKNNNKDKKENNQTEMRQLHDGNKNWKQILNQCLFDLDLDYPDS